MAKMKYTTSFDTSNATDIISEFERLYPLFVWDHNYVDLNMFCFVNSTYNIDGNIETMIPQLKNNYKRCCDFIQGDKFEQTCTAIMTMYEAVDLVPNVPGNDAISLILERNEDNKSYWYMAQFVTIGIEMIPDMLESYGNNTRYLNKFSRKDMLAFLHKYVELFAKYMTTIAEFLLTLEPDTTNPLNTKEECIAEFLMTVEPDTTNPLTTEEDCKSQHVSSKRLIFK